MTPALWTLAFLLLLALAWTLAAYDADTRRDSGCGCPEHDNGGTCER